MLLGLMYILKLLYAIRYFKVVACLGFQLVGGGIKGQALPFLLVFLNFFARKNFLHS
jgi:hypothetical protein